MKNSNYPKPEWSMAQNSKNNPSPGRPVSQESLDILMNAPVGICTTTPEGRYISANITLARMYGYDTPEELISSVADIAAQIYADPADRIKFKRLLEEHGQVNNFECRFRRRDGTEIWVSKNTRALRDEKGRIVAYQGFTTDITDRKRSEQALQLSENYYQSVFETSGAAQAIIGQDTTIIMVNSKFEAITGYSKEEIEGKKSWTEFVHQDDLTRMKEHHYTRRLDADKAPREYKFRFIDRHDQVHNIFLNVDLILGTTQSVISMIDITGLIRAEDELRKQEELKHLLMDLATGCINVSLEKIDQAINELLEEIGKFTQADRLYIFRHDHTKQTSSNIHEWCAQGISPGIDNNQSIPFEFFRDMLDSFEKGNVVHIPYVDQMREDHKMRAIFLQQDIKSLIMVPMLQDGINIGYVGFDSVKNTRKFTENEINILKVLAGIISSVLARQQAEEIIRRTSLKLREMAMTDELTGLSNRRFFFTQGEKEIERAKRFKTPVSLLMMDLDNFKKINDTLGHEAGDKVLQNVASVFGDNIRHIDILGRIGGEEFCVLLPNTSREDATVLAERLRLAAEQTTCLVRGLSVNVTVSIGLVSANGDALSLDSLLSRVDAAMYQAKGKGRNRIVIASG